MVSPNSSRIRRSNSAQPLAFTWASKPLPRVIANGDCPNGAGWPTRSARRCLLIPAASSTLRRWQPGLVDSAAIVRALWVPASPDPRSRFRRMSVLFTALPSRGSAASWGRNRLHVGRGTCGEPHGRAEELLDVVELGTGTCSARLAVRPVGVYMDVQLCL